MANRRHKITPIVARERAPSKEKHAENLRFLSRKGWAGDPTNKRAVTRAAAEYRARDTIRTRYGRKVSRETATDLRKHGFTVEQGKLVLDKPRARAKVDKTRPQLPARFTVLKGGVVKYAYKERRDYIFGFNQKKKDQFALQSSEVINELIARVRKWTKTKKKPQIRLQWGAFESRKDFSPQQFAKAIETARKVAAMLIKKYGPKVKTPLDNLTGVHIVVHKSPSKKRSRRK